MKLFTLSTTLFTALAQGQDSWQEVLLPDNPDLWRTMPDIPYAWLADTLRYAIFEGDDGNMYMTV